MYFGRQLPLSVINRITSQLDPFSQINLSNVNQTWRDYLFDWTHVMIMGSNDVSCEMLLPHLRKVVSKKTKSIVISKLTIGCSPWAESYKVDTGKECFVIRKIKHSNNRKHEILASLYFSEVGIAPKVEYFDFDAGIIIMRFCENEPALLRKLENSQLDDLALKLRSIHQGPKLARPIEVERSTLFLVRRKQIEKMIMEFPEFYVFSYILEQLDYLATLTKEDVFCHNDINPNNLLAQTNNILFIDWESSGCNDAFLDIATIVATLRLDNSKGDYLLEKYLGENPSADQRTHFNCMKQLALLRFAISFAANLEKPEDVRSIDIKSIPAFNQYIPDKHGVVDKSSDVGKYFISIMLVKQAMQTINDYHFKHTIATYYSARSQLHYLPIPDTFWYKVLNSLPIDGHAKLASLNHAWKEIVDSYHEKSHSITLERILAISKTENIGFRLWTAIKSFMPNPRGILEQLSGGLSPFCQNFILTIGCKKYAIKVEASNDVTFTCQSMVNFLASKINVSPIVEKIDFPNRVQISHYVNNNSSWHIQRKPSHLAELAAMLRKFHSTSQIKMSYFFKNDKFNEMCKTVLKQIKNLLFLKEFDQAILLIRQIEPVLAADIKQVICHFDVNPWNILYAEEQCQFKLIDWEFTTIGQPIIDVAIIANFLRLNAVEETFFLMAYMNKEITRRDEATFFIAKLYAYLRYAICSLAINGNENYSIDNKKVEELPCFNEFNPRNLKIDIKSSEGRYYIAKMFLKGAYELIEQVDFVEILKTYRLLDTKEVLDAPRVPFLEDKTDDAEISNLFRTP